MLCILLAGLLLNFQPMQSSTSVAKMLRWGEELQDEIYRYKTLIEDRQDIVDPCLKDDYL